MSDHPMPMLDGSVLDVARPWPLPADTERNLLALAHAKASPRRFTGEEPSALAELED